MKPIPAIDENREFVEATLVGGATVIVLCFEGEVIRALEPPGYMWQLVPGSFKDWPAVRERVERARLSRRVDALNALQREGQERGEYDSAASKDHGEVMRNFQRFNAELLDSQVRALKRPSFAEALEREIANDLSRVDHNPIRSVTPAMLYDWLLSARAASGE